MLYALVNVSLRLLIWVLPVFLYLRWIDGVDPLVYLKLRNGWQRGVAIGLLTTLLFVAIHLPGWISLHLLRAEMVLFVFVFGLVLAIIFCYAQSLWSVIVAHSLNDFLAGFLFKL